MTQGDRMKEQGMKVVGRSAVGTAVVLASALALSACGSDADSGSDKGGGATHTVKTVNGPVKVPDKPKRVVVLDTAELDSVVTLGIKPVGATTALPGKPFLSYLPKDELKGVENVGAVAQPNMEKIAALKPDLILTNKDRDADRYDELSQIAPTVMTKTTGYPWKENFQAHADALGKKAEAKKVLADYTAHTAKVTEALGGEKKARSLQTSVIRFTQGADTRIYGKKAYIGTLLDDVKLGRPGGQAGEGVRRPGAGGQPRTGGQGRRGRRLLHLVRRPEEVRRGQGRQEPAVEEHAGGQGRQSLPRRGRAVDPGHRLHGGRKDPRRDAGGSGEVTDPAT